VKPRPPSSAEQAIHRIVGVLGWDGTAAALGIGESAARKKADPDCTTNRLYFDEAIALDIAYRQAGGDGAPLHETHALRLSLAEAAITSTNMAIQLAAGAASKEAGEAVSWAIIAAQPGATAYDRQRAMREIKEAMDALQVAYAKLGAGPGDAMSSPGGQLP